MTDGLLAFLGPSIDIAKAILGVGGLIFVHELGHFLVGRWCGVRAEAFSIGFGPVIAKWQPGPTEYRLSAFPLGGYVKFLGENPDERDEPSPDSFHAATYPRKVAIMLAGVTMNALAAFVLFVLAFRGGINVVPPVVGGLVPGMPAWVHGLEVGDEIVSIDGSAIRQFEDLQQAVFFADEVELVVRREGESLPPIRMRPARGSDGLGRLGIQRPASRITLAVRPGSAAAEAGFENGDEVVSVDGVPQTSAQAAIALAEQSDDPTRWTVRRGDETVELDIAPAEQDAWIVGVFEDSATILVRSGGAAESAGARSGDAPVAVGSTEVTGFGAAVAAIVDPGSTGSLFVERAGARVEIPLPETADGRAAFAQSMSLDRTRFVVTPSRAAEGPYPAEAAGLGPLSTLLEADGKTLNEINDLRAVAQEAGAEARPLRLRWQDQDGTVHEADVALVATGARDTGLAVSALSSVLQEKRILQASILGVERTHEMLWNVLGTLGALVTGKVSPERLSGPLVIAKVSYDTSKSGWGEFLLFLGFISINLAVLNLLPIPVLDGGQLMVISIEKVRGKPLPENILYGVQMTGLLMLLSLMVYVVWNDIEKLT